MRALRKRSRWGIWAAVALAALLSACLWSDEDPPWVYTPDMREAIPYESFSSNPVFADGKTLQAPASGSIARGHLPLPFGPGPEEAARAGESLYPPIEPTPANLARGEHLYTSFCAVCHGEAGLGDGPIIPKLAPPPAYTSPPIRDYPPGRLMHVATWGTGRMNGYRGQIAAEDRWRIVLYVQTLQQAQGATP